MKTKQTFAIIIAALFVCAMLIYGDKMTFGEIAGAFAGQSLLISTIWQWFSKEEVKVRNRWLEKREKYNQTRIKNLQEQNDYLFAKAYGGPKNK